MYIECPADEAAGVEQHAAQSSIEPVVPPYDDRFYFAFSNGIFNVALPNDFIAWILRCLDWPGSKSASLEYNREPEPDELFCKSLTSLLTRSSYNFHPSESFFHMAVTNGPFCDRLDGSNTHFRRPGPGPLQVADVERLTKE